MPNVTNLTRTNSAFFFLPLSLAFCFAAVVTAHTCPDDHVGVGCNPDGLWTTTDEPNDDRQLFVDFTQVYRHSDPNDTSANSWANWYYPLFYSVIYQDYNVGEPGFTQLWYSNYPGGPVLNAQHQLAGTAGVDYDLWVRCVDISPQLRAKERETSNFTIPDDTMEFNLSTYAEHHIHMKYRAPTQCDLYWITFEIYDRIGRYQTSKPFTFVFGRSPLPGDVWVDGGVDYADLAHLVSHWTQGYDPADPNCLTHARQSDYCQRADINQDFTVDLLDWARLAKNWLEALAEQ